MGKLQALYDGIFTGLDPIGTAVGHKTGNKYFVGYIADKYSLNKVQSDLNEFRPMFDGAGIKYKEPESVDRTVGEQIFKGVGDSIGLVANVIILGLPQAALLLQAAGKHYQRLKTEHYLVPLAHRLFQDASTESLK